MAVAVATNVKFARTANLPTVSGPFTTFIALQITANTGTYQGISGFGHTSNFDSVYDFAWEDPDGGGGMYLNSYESGTDTFNSYPFGSRPSVGEWFFAAVTCAGGSANQFTAYWSLYSDDTWVQPTGHSGSTAGQLANGGTGLSANTLHFCDLTFGFGNITAEVEGLGIYNRALSLEELKILKWTRWPVNPLDINCFWPLPATGLTSDFSGNARNPTVSGTPTAATSGPPASDVLWPPYGHWAGAGAVAYSLDIGSGAYSLTGSGATLRADRNIGAASRALSLTGSGVGLRKDSVLQAASGAFTLTGAAADLRRTYVLNAAGGQFSLTGAGADLTYSPAASAYTLDAAGGAYSLIGSAANLAVARYLGASGGVYSLTGAGVSLLKASRLQASGGAYNLTGAGVELRRGFRIDAASGHFDLTGSPAELSTTQPQHYTLECAGGSFTLDGGEARLVWSGEPVASTKPPGGGRGRRILFRGREYDSIRDRQYLAHALSEFVEERVERVEPAQPKPKKRKPKPTFTKAEIREIKPVLQIVAPQKSLADYVADLQMQEDEQFLMLAAA